MDHDVEAQLLGEIELHPEGIRLRGFPRPEADHPGLVPASRGLQGLVNGRLPAGKELPGQVMMIDARLPDRDDLGAEGKLPQ